MSTGFAAACALALSGCAPQMEAAGAAAVAPVPCGAPLSAYCDGGCPTFDEAFTRAKLEIDARIRCDVEGDSFPPGVTVGDCGGLRVVTICRGDDSTAEYFTGEGKLVGAIRTADYPRYCARTNEALRFGTIPACVERTTTTLCPSPRRAPVR
jgi:hypothetical protein